MSVALGTIFILNAIALFIFPVIGHALNMSQHEFGTWAAVAIHDTSSVVGAGAAYGGGVAGSYYYQADPCALDYSVGNCYLTYFQK